MSPTWNILQWLGLLFQVFVVILAIWLYRIRRTRSFAFLLLACICHVVMHSTWFTFNFAAGFAHAGPDAIARVRALAYDTSRIFHVLFLVFMALALISFIRDCRTIVTPTA
jgi:hypothetical protein